jgi:monoamine oxidase
VKGAWTDLKKGEIWMLAESRKPEGRMHFAGEHTSIWSGWMNGALESGRRAATEIIGQPSVTAMIGQLYRMNRARFFGRSLRA